MDNDADDLVISIIKCPMMSSQCASVRVHMSPGQLSFEQGPDSPVVRGSALGRRDLGSDPRRCKNFFHDSYQPEKLVVRDSDSQK